MESFEEPLVRRLIEKIIDRIRRITYSIASIMFTVAFQTPMHREPQAAASLGYARRLFVARGVVQGSKCSPSLWTNRDSGVAIG